MGRARASRSPHPSMRVLGAAAGGEEPEEWFCALGLAWPFLWARLEGQGGHGSPAMYRALCEEGTGCVLRVTPGPAWEGQPRLLLSVCRG